MESTDVLVVGGGVVGVCAAHYLNESGYDVMLVESGEIGGGASHGNMGLIVPSHSVPLAAPGDAGRPEAITFFSAFSSNVGCNKVSNVFGSILKIASLFEINLS